MLCFLSTWSPIWPDDHRGVITWGVIITSNPSHQMMGHPEQGEKCSFQSQRNTYQKYWQSLRYMYTDRKKPSRHSSHQMMGFPKQWKYIYTSRPILTAQWTGYWTEHILQQYGFRTLSYGNISEDQDSDLATHNISDTFQIIMGREIGHQLGTGIIWWHILDTGQPIDIQQLQINWSMAKWAVFVQQRKSIKSFAISNPKPPGM